MKDFLSALLWVWVLGWAAPLSADPSETRNKREYGNCEVITSVNLFTDAESHAVGCQANTRAEAPPIVSLYLGEEGFLILLSAGPQALSDPPIPVLIRVDKGELIQRSVTLHRGHWVVMDEPRLAFRLLHALARGARVVFRVGEKDGLIRLDGAQRAIEDFRDRTALAFPRELTISPHETAEKSP